MVYSEYEYHVDGRGDYKNVTTRVRAYSNLGLMANYISLDLYLNVNDRMVPVRKMDEEFEEENQCDCSDPYCDNKEDVVNYYLKKIEMATNLEEVSKTIDGEGMFVLHVYGIPYEVLIHVYLTDIDRARYEEAIKIYAELTEKVDRDQWIDVPQWHYFLPLSKVLTFVINENVGANLARHYEVKEVELGSSYKQESIIRLEKLQGGNTNDSGEVLFPDNLNYANVMLRFNLDLTKFSVDVDNEGEILVSGNFAWSQTGDQINEMLREKSLRLSYA